MSPRPLVPPGTVQPATLPAAFVEKLTVNQQRFVGLLYVGLTLESAAAQIPWTTGNAKAELHKIYGNFAMAGEKKGKLNELIRSIKDEFERERQAATQSEETPPRELRRAAS